MEVVVHLLAGIFVAACIFAATFFAAAQAFRQTGGLRWAHGLAAGLTVAAMATLSGGLWTLSQILGLGLIPAAAAALILDRGWNRLLPLTHVGFGAALAAGLPFGG